jgi:hypothetical protein
LPTGLLDEHMFETLPEYQLKQLTKVWECTQAARPSAPPRAARYVAANAPRPYFARVCAIGGWRRGHGTGGDREVPWRAVP